MSNTGAGRLTILMFISRSVAENKRCFWPASAGVRWPNRDLNEPWVEDDASVDTAEAIQPESGIRFGASRCPPRGLSGCSLRTRPHYADELSTPPNGGVEPPRVEAERSAGTTCYLPIRWLPTRVPLATWHTLANFLSKRDNDALRPADVG